MKKESVRRTSFCIKKIIFDFGKKIFYSKANSFNFKNKKQFNVNVKSVAATMIYGSKCNCCVS